MSRLERKSVHVRKHKRKKPNGGTTTVRSHKRKQKVRVGGSETKSKSAEEIHETRSNRTKEIVEESEKELIDEGKIEG